MESLSGSKCLIATFPDKAGARTSHDDIMKIGIRPSSTRLSLDTGKPTIVIELDGSLGVAEIEEVVRRNGGYLQSKAGAVLGQWHGAVPDQSLSSSPNTTARWL